jgi:hydrogenase nickel incorporation protein HypB
MCDSCGCDDTKTIREKKTVEVNQSLLKANKEEAASNRKNFNEKGILAINLISSPGSGKTTLLEKTIEILGNDISIGVLEGDIETELDAERIREKGAPAVQLTTGGACHLESRLIHKGFHKLEQQLNGKKLDILFIENVGNLVCPSFFDLGEHIRVVLISVPEGHDKPVKYPKAIITSQVLIISKSDLLQYFDFDIEKIKKDALALNPNLEILVTSATNGEGMEEWFELLKKNLISHE